MLFAAATATAAEVERWFDYPLIRLGEQTITILTLAKIAFWIIAVLVLNIVLQRMVLRRVLKHTRLSLGLQFAIAKTVAAIAVGLLGGFGVLVMQRMGILVGEPLRDGIRNGGCAGSKIRNPKDVVWRYWHEPAPMPRYRSSPA